MKPIATITGLAVALLGGCLTYHPTQLSAMSAVDLCEVQSIQGPNLSAKGRQSIQDELRRRQENCANHTREVAQRYEDFLWREMYGNASP